MLPSKNKLRAPQGMEKTEDEEYRFKSLFHNR